MLSRSAGLVLVTLIMFSGCCVERCAMNADCAPTCDGDACGSCGTCGPCEGLLSPLHCLLGCGSGCGELYYDEWLSDPPQCCDPCDNCGNWVGAVDSCRWNNCPLNGCNLWGVRFHGCAGAATEDWDDGQVVDEQWSDEMVSPEEAPSGEKEMTPKKADPHQQPQKKTEQTQKSALKKRTPMR